VRQYLRTVLMGRDEAKELRAFQLNGFLRGRHDRLHDQRLADLRVMVRRRLRLGLAGGLATSFLTAAAVAALVWFVTTGRLDAAAAATAAGAVVLLSQRLSGLTYSVGAIYESALFLEDFTTFVDAAPALAAARPHAAPPARFSELSVDRVSFTYPGGLAPSLRDVSLTVRAGEVVALVGPNGSGKTTLAKLLAGLYQPATGTIRWDGEDAATFDPDLLRAKVAVIFQDFVRYFLTVGENIGLGRHERVADAEGLAGAAARAGADEFIQGLGRGYDTRLGPQYDGGTDLSVGQWQRVALARAYFRDAPFLVLDEPTAALDPRGEAELFEGIRGLATGRAVLLISHRFASVRSADRIYVLQEGTVVESGDHVELMGRQGLYAELFELQAGAYGPVPRI
jgi:ATP-binding cassette subfamily B protein